MKTHRSISILSLSLGLALAITATTTIAIAEDKPQQQRQIANPTIDFRAFLVDGQAAYKHRQNRRVTAEEFIRMATESGTIILDTRSKDAYDQKHIAGARHLNFSDITVQSLEKAIPDKTTRILIYCNNNFTNNSPAFMPKSFGGALNIPTFITLYNYGYRNLYELGPLLDEQNTILKFEGTSVK